MSWFYLIFLLCFLIGNLEARNLEKKNPSAVVVGTVFCDTCFRGDFSKSSHFISGASVAVECKDENSKRSFREEVKTDEHGEFKVHLPFSVSKHVKKIKRCSVKLISSREPYCAVASTATSSSLHLKERKQGIHIFSAGFFTFKPLKQPNLCNQKPSLENSEELNSKKTSVPSFNNPGVFPPPIQDPTSPPGLPQLPLLPRLPPLPQLPSLPPLPGLPNLPPMPGKLPAKKPEETPRETKLSEQKVAHPEFFLPTPPLPPNPFLPTPTPTLPPNPLQPPPLFPPNPLQPPPLFPPNPLRPPPLLPPNPLQPPPLLPPNPLMPPPSPLIPLPPIPGLTPPPPQPTFPIPLPPLPPGFPGIPPAFSPNKASP
ncbi:Pollen Ole e 1 allergen/extensin [Melia azedarach]|uniref:Pollen Ole e 1 allergen/extensin n=1 Tax=Melia azedarach TaxID=155640 RepID=A0ACC1X8F0_MELAZ|nr:Pollen Ole e 1 allergen/extensin [Melia azedarach]